MRGDGMDAVIDSRLALPGAALAAVIVVALAGCGSSTELPATAARTETFQVRGAVIIHSPDAFTGPRRGEDGDECSGRGRAAGLAADAAIVVAGSGGDRVGQGVLAPGRLNVDYHATTATCSFEIDVGHVRRRKSDGYKLSVGGYEATFMRAGAGAVFIDVP